MRNQEREREREPGRTVLKWIEEEKNEIEMENDD